MSFVNLALTTVHCQTIKPPLQAKGGQSEKSQRFGMCIQTRVQLSHFYFPLYVRRVFKVINQFSFIRQTLRGSQRGETRRGRSESVCKHSFTYSRKCI